VKEEPTTFDTVRELGLALPGAEEARYWVMPALKIDGKVFVVRAGHRSAAPNSISVPFGFKRRDQLIAADPRVFYLKRHYEPYPVVLVRLDRIDRMRLKRLLRSAYRAVSVGSVVPGRSRIAHRSPIQKKIVRRRRRSIRRH
jgi:hypothetical protein